MPAEPKRRIRICMGSSCFSRGNKQNLPIIQQFLDENGISAEVEITGSLCRELCSQGPMITIDDRDYFHTDPSALISLLKQEFGK